MREEVLSQEKSRAATEIIALVAELAPKVIGTGKSVVDLWQSAGGISAPAKKTGKVDVDATLLSADQRSARFVEAISSERRYDTAP